jgi:hypothetical protein
MIRLSGSTEVSRFRPELFFLLHLPFFHLLGKSRVRKVTYTIVTVLNLQCAKVAIMQMPPLAVIESWPPPNYVDPVTRGSANIIINLILFPLVCLFIALRVYTRLWIAKSFGADDWLILASLVCFPFQINNFRILISLVPHRCIFSYKFACRITLQVE